MRRDKLRSNGGIASVALPCREFVERAPENDLQQALHEEARARLHANIRTDSDRFDKLEAYFGPPGEDEFSAASATGWARCAWSRPNGAALGTVVERLKSLKLTIRNAPLAQAPCFPRCLFTACGGNPHSSRILTNRTRAAVIMSYKVPRCCDPNDPARTPDQPPAGTP